MTPLAIQQSPVGKISHPPRTSVQTEDVLPSRSKWEFQSGISVNSQV
jgi:hypothetical protein